MCVFVFLRACVSSASKCLDTRSNSSDAQVQDANAKFTYEKMMESFDDPTCPLFLESVNAELTRFPELLDLNPEKAEKWAPNAMAFSNGGRRYVKSLYIGVSKHHHACGNLCLTPRTCRRKGYYKCRNLCRVWVIRCFKLAHRRGEYFVKFVNPRTGKVYDGRNVLAHFITINYAHLHEPPMSLIFNQELGFLEQTGILFRNIRR